MLEPVATALEAVVERLAGDALIAVDPNIRPWVIDDRGGLPRAAAAGARAQPRREGQRGGPGVARARPAAGRGRRARCSSTGRRSGCSRAGRAAPGRDPHRRGGGPGPARQGRRHDRGRRRVRRRLPRLVARARPDPRRPRHDRPRGRGDGVRVPGRRAHLLAAGRVAPIPVRARLAASCRGRSSRRGSRPKCSRRSSCSISPRRAAARRPAGRAGAGAGAPRRPPRGWRARARGCSFDTYGHRVLLWGANPAGALTRRAPEGPGGVYGARRTGRSGSSVRS